MYFKRTSNSSYVHDKKYFNLMFLSCSDESYKSGCLYRLEAIEEDQQSIQTFYKGGRYGLF